jgi:hypothetical protein
MKCVLATCSLTAISAGMTKDRNVRKGTKRDGGGQVRHCRAKDCAMWESVDPSDHFRIFSELGIRHHLILLLPQSHSYAHQIISEFFLNLAYDTTSSSCYLSLIHMHLGCQHLSFYVRHLFLSWLLSAIHLHLFHN